VTPSKPDLCIYHGNCADGFTAAWAIWRRWPDVEFLAHSYGQVAPNVKGKHVLIVDYSFKRPVLEDMGKYAESITVLDHHKSAEADLAPFSVEWTALEKNIVLAERSHFAGTLPIQAFFDMDRSGAMLAWQYAHGFQNRVPKLVEHVQDRDLWKFDLGGTREISSVLFSHDFSFPTWDNISVALDDSLGWEEVVSEGNALERKFQRDLVGLLEQTTRTMKIGGVTVPVANVPYLYASEAGNILSKDKPFAAAYYDANDGTRRFSLRASEGGADVSQIASAYGGGGHAKAAGFAMPLGWEGDD
jgi:uncharacterized protein